MHGPLKDLYQLWTNFHEFAEQVTIMDFIGNCENLYFLNRFFVQIIGSMFQDTLRPWLHLWRSNKQESMLQVQKN